MMISYLKLQRNVLLVSLIVFLFCFFSFIYVYLSSKKAGVFLVKNGSLMLFFCILLLSRYFRKCILFGFFSCI